MSPKMRYKPEHVCDSTEKKHFLTEKYPKLKKNVRQAACQAAGRPGQSAVGSAILYFITN